MTTLKDLQKTETQKITSIFNPEDYKTYEEAMDNLEFIARNQNLPEKQKILFNRNFYGFVSLTDKHFEVEVDMVQHIAKGIAKLDALPVSEKDSITLIGDGDKYTLKLLDTEGKYGSTFRPDSGKCKYPSHWFSFYHVVLSNQL